MVLKVATIACTTYLEESDSTTRLEKGLNFDLTRKEAFTMQCWDASRFGVQFNVDAEDYTCHTRTAYTIYI